MTMPDVWIAAIVMYGAYRIIRVSFAVGYKAGYAECEALYLSDNDPDDGEREPLPEETTEASASQHNNVFDIVKRQNNA